MILEDALAVIVESLKKDILVQAIFLKGSIGRGEHDKHSDIDLYCLVDEEDVENFLSNRISHLKTVGELLFYDDIFIIAPQIIAVYDHLLHIDLFTVTERTLVQKDFMKVLYDPQNILEKYKHNQSLYLSNEEFQDAVDDVAWFLFQYKKSAERGNHLWACHMLHHVMSHLAKVLLHHYCPQRALLGLKTISTSIPIEIAQQMNEVTNHITTNHHRQAAHLLCRLLQNEHDWVFENVDSPERIQPFWNRIMNLY